MSHRPTLFYLISKNIIFDTLFDTVSQRIEKKHNKYNYISVLKCFSGYSLVSGRSRLICRPFFKSPKYLTFNNIFILYFDKKWFTAELISCSAVSEKMQGENIEWWKNTARNHGNEAQIYTLQWYWKNSVVFLLIYLFMEEQITRITDRWTK